MQLTEKQKNQLFALVRKYEEGKATPQEAAFVEAYYDYFDKEEKILNGLSEQQKEDIQNRLFNNIFSQEEKQDSLTLSHKRKTIWRFTAAAVILIAVGAGLFVKYGHTFKQADNPVVAKNDALPGSNKAILTISGGKRIILDSNTQGIINKAGGLTVQNHEGTLSYSGHADNVPVAYNTITVPRGGQYRLELADGTKVWLNSESSLTYPTYFTGIERAVTLTGEGYFEVVHNGKLPFRVHTGGSIIEDIGTKFNINAYGDETLIKTTLEEGAVKVGGTMLSPGEQAQVNKKGEIKVIPDADVEEALAWKNGFFEFDHADIQTIGRQIARWYDLDVEFLGTLPKRTFRAKMPRDTHASEILKILEASSIHCSIEGKKLIIMP